MLSSRLSVWSLHPGTGYPLSQFHSLYYRTLATPPDLLPIQYPQNTGSSKQTPLRLSEPPFPPFSHHPRPSLSIGFASVPKACLQFQPSGRHPSLSTVKPGPPLTSQPRLTPPHSSTSTTHCACFPIEIVPRAGFIKEVHLSVSDLESNGRRDRQPGRSLQWVIARANPSNSTAKVLIHVHSGPYSPS